MQDDKTPMKENLTLSSKTIYAFTLGPAISFLRFLQNTMEKKKTTQQNVMFTKLFMTALFVIAKIQKLLISQGCHNKLASNNRNLLCYSPEG